ncbi:unnamed protein product [Arabis nemorensis]|uniref:Uncharacterized protein n=1 Tax=Arabis nemorensis TaxID=586526 RepID=A0A565CWI3_9BRAS|nr:unnamed protein product [Arabis nemorensis]
MMVTCILSPLDEDEEDSVSIEDVADAELDEVVKLVKQGYRITKYDWDHRSIDIVNATEAIAQ